MRKIEVTQVGARIAVFTETMPEDTYETKMLTEDEADRVAFQIGAILQDMNKEREETERVRDI